MTKFAIMVIACIALHGFAEAQSPQAQPKIVSMRGELFDTDRGAFVFPDLFERGAANALSMDALLIVVELGGPPLAKYTGKGKPHYELRLTGTQLGGTKRIFRSMRPITSMNQDGKRFLSFLVYDVQCTPLNVVAEVLGPGSHEPYQVAVGLHCGQP